MSSAYDFHYGFCGDRRCRVITNFDGKHVSGIFIARRSGETEHHCSPGVLAVDLGRPGYPEQPFFVRSEVSHDSFECLFGYVVDSWFLDIQERDSIAGGQRLAEEAGLNINVERAETAPHLRNVRPINSITEQGHRRWCTSAVRLRNYDASIQVIWRSGIENDGFGLLESCIN